MLEKGLTYQQNTTVKKEDTAAKVASGSLMVYGTPAMIAFIENTALTAVEKELDKGETTVGTQVNINHLSPTPVGEKVTCSVELTEVKGPKLKFKVIVNDEHNKIGEGEHLRYIVNKNKFMNNIKR